MLVFKIEMEVVGFQEHVDIYSRGHITVEGRYGTISSKQSMMIFISLCDFLDGVRLLLISPNKSSYHFVGVGSSFQFFVIKKGASELMLTSLKNEVIDETTHLALVEDIWKSINPFVLNHSHLLDDKGLKFSMEEFKKQFHL
jgi:hypothetical protein